MIQSIIIASAGLVALILCILRGPEEAFLNVYLPVVLFLPEYRWGSLGQFSFADFAILPIAAFLLLRPKQKWEWNSIDFLVIAYVAITVVAEGMNKGYKFGSQNLLLEELASILLPYVLAKHMFRYPQFTVDAAKRIVVPLVIVAIISVYEFRMGTNLFSQFFEGVFPPINDTGLMRAGFMRTQGPYGHAITLGMMMAIGFRVARWLEWNGVWSDRLSFLQISKIRFCELGIVAGSVMSLSVGPWVGAACGAVIVSICRSHNRKRTIVSLILLMALIGPPTYRAFKAYVSVDRLAGHGLQEDAAYRNEMIPLYIPIVEERATWGWGRAGGAEGGGGGFPKLNGMWSIDNAYLLTALTFGVYALGVMVALFVWPPIRLAIFSFPFSRSDPRALAAFSMIGIFALNVVTDATASGGGAPWLLFFIIAGWSSALLSASATETVGIDAVKSWPQTQLGFRRVMV